MIGIEAVLDRPGSTPLRMTPLVDSLRWTTSAVGGFGSCSFGLPGDWKRWKREIPHLAVLTIVLDTQVLWQGQVEDVTLRIAGGNIGAGVQAFGLLRKLDETSVRRVWSLRDLPWSKRPKTTEAEDPAFDSTIGAYNIADLTQSGLQVAGNGGTCRNPGASGDVILMPDGLTLIRLMLTYEKAGHANLFVEAYSGVENTYTLHASTNGNTAGTDLDAACAANATTILLRHLTNASFVTAVTDYVRFRNIRVLGTSVVEDASGGFYGGTILRDLIPLVPGLTIGVIESGSDFTIQQIERSVRSSARSVVDEVASYYSREWGVWEDGMFNWEAVNFDEPQWMIQIADLDDGSELTSTVDGISKTVYVLYTDAVSDRTAEATATATAQRNPYVKQGKTKDLLVNLGFPTTGPWKTNAGGTTSGDPAGNAAQIAGRIRDDTSGYPPIQGRLVIPATKIVKRASGSSRPAFMIRAGENILISDMPKTELFSQGRDGETLFHIVGTEASLEDGRVILEVEGQTKRSDVLLARLAAATRAITG